MTIVKSRDSRTHSEDSRLAKSIAEFGAYSQLISIACIVHYIEVTMVIIRLVCTKTFID